MRSPKPFCGSRATRAYGKSWRGTRNVPVRAFPLVPRQRALRTSIGASQRRTRSIDAMPALPRALKVAHLTTVDVSLRFLLLAQLRAVRDAGGEAIGISAPGAHVGELE